VSGLAGLTFINVTIARTTYRKVIALVRKPLTIKHIKLEQLQVVIQQLEAELTTVNFSGPSVRQIDHIFCPLAVP